jgi:hypothetical protein
MVQTQKALQAIRALIGENLLLRDALIKIQHDPQVSGTSFQIAKLALEQVGKP